MPMKAPPLHQQISEVLRNQIVTGQIAVGDVLSTEMELTQTFKVSRSTVRHAIRTLAEDGMVQARPGVGTVVIRTRPIEQHSYLRGLTEDLARQGVATQARVLTSEMIEATPAIRARLALHKGERVLHLGRLRYIADTPLALIHSYVPESLGIRADEDFSGPLYNIIERRHDHMITFGKDVIGARLPTHEEAQYLDVDGNMPVLVIRRTAYTEHERPVEYVEGAIRSDLYEYHVTLPRRKE